MKRNKLYYILFVLYILATAFVLYVNGIFTGNVASFLNLAINGVFLLDLLCDPDQLVGAPVKSGKAETADH